MKTKTNGTQIHEKLNACCYLMNYKRTDHSLIFAQKITSPSAVFPSNQKSLLIRSPQNPEVVCSAFVDAGLQSLQICRRRASVASVDGCALLVPRPRRAPAARECCWLSP